MSKSIDERVVEMRFDNAAFQKGIDTSMKSLTELDKGLAQTNGTKAFDGIGDSVGYLSAKFSALQVAGVTALATLVNKAVDAGIRIARSLAIEPVSEGWSDYNTKLTSVQTVMNATGKSIDVVNSYFDQLDEYADKTIYNLTDMTSSLAKFVNAGVSLETAVPAIKGIANAVALAGQDAGAAQIAMYNLSQSIAGGFLTTTDYKSLNLANVATKELKQYIVDTAVAMGTLKKAGEGTYTIVGAKTKEAIKMTELFNGKLSEGWATSEVLLKTFGDFGDINTEIGKKALEAAQSIKSVPMMMETLRAGVGTTWTETFEYIFGDVIQAKETLTGLTLSIQSILDVFNNGRNEIIKGWSEGGGRDALFGGIQNIIDAVLKIVTVMKDAWAAVFPNKSTVNLLVKITEGFEKFTSKLILSDNAMEVLKNSLRVIFTVLKLVGSIVGGVFKLILGVLKPIIGVFKLTGDGAAEVSDKFADWVQNLLLLWQNSKFLKTVMVRAKELGETIAEHVSKAVAWLEKAKDAIVAFFKGANSGAADSKFGGFLQTLNQKGVEFGFWLRDQKKLLDKAMVWFTSFRTTFTTTIQKMIGGFSLLKKDKNGVSFAEKIKNGFKSFIDFMPKIVDAFKVAIDFILNSFQRAKDIGTSIGQTIKSIWDAITSVLKGVDPNVALGTLNLGLFVAAMSGFKKLLKALGFDAITEALKGFTGAVKGMSLQLKAQAILTIAFALAVLAGSMLLFAQIPADRFGDVVTAMGLMGAVLIGMMKQLQLVTKAIESGSIVATAAALVVIAGALVLVALAAKLMATVDGAALAKAGGGLVALIGAMIVLDKANIGGPNLVKTATAMMILGLAMITLAGGIKVMSLLDMDTFAKGVVLMAGTIAVLGAAMNLWPEKASLSVAFSFAVLAGSLSLMAQAFKAWNALDIDKTTDSMKQIAVMLVLLIGAMWGAKNAVAGAAALAIIIAALGGLVLVIERLIQIPTAQVFIAIGAIAALLAVIVAAGAISQGPVMAGLLAIAAVLTAIGLAALGVGAGIFLFVSAMQKLIEIGQLGAPVIINSLANLTAALPAFANLIIQFFLQLLTSLATNIDAILKIVVSVLISVLNSLAPVVDKAIDFIFDVLEVFFKRLWEYLLEMVPIWAETATQMVAGFIQGIADNIGLVIDAATDLITEFLDGMARSIPQIADSVTNLIVTFLAELDTHIQEIIVAGTALITNFIEGIGKASLAIITAAGETLITFMEGIEAWIRDNSTRINEAGLDIGKAIIDGMTGGLTDGIKKVSDAASKVVNGLTGGVKKLLGIHSPSKVFKEIGEYVAKGFAEGLKSGDKQYVQDSWDNMRKSLKDFVADANADLKKHKANLKELQKNPRKNAKAIKEEQKAIAQLTKERDKALATYKMMGKYLVDERNKLKKLSDQYAAVTEKLEAARDALADAKQERADYQASTKDAFDDYLSIDAETKLDDFMTAMHKQLDDMQTLRNNLETVRAMGLNDKLYKQLVEGDVDLIPFLDQIINGGQSAIDELNQMSKDLDTISQGLGDDASSNLYDAGVHMAEGLVAGLESQQAELQKQMDKLAEYMVNAINKKLGIKSPSRVMAQVGEYTVDGLVKGLQSSADLVANASESVASEAVSAFEKTLSGLKDAVPDDMSINPTITPVLDLTQITAGSAALDKMLYNKQLVVDTSAANAAVVAAAVKANEDATTTGSSPDMVSEITFVQNNNSPKALSPAEIYRQTTNQLSRAKGALTP